MIEKINLKKLRNNEFIQFGENVQEIVQINNPQTLKVENEYNDLEDPLTKLHHVQNKKQGSPITNELIEINKRRDVALGSIFTIVETYCNHFEEEVVATALDLKKELDLYGRDIIRYSYQYETNAIDDILSKWELKAEGIATLNLTDWVIELKDANTLFNSRFLDRIKESALDQDLSVLELRNTMSEKIYNLFDMLSALMKIEKSDIYANVIDQINALINQYNKTLVARHSKKSSKSTSEEDDKETDTTETT